MIKIDLLGLRMLSAIEDAVTIIEGQTGIRPDLDDLPPNDPTVFDMLCRGQTIGVFQVESRAQADLIPRFQPRSFADLVIEISLIRPEPIQANMVHPICGDGRVERRCAISIRYSSRRWKRRWA